MKDIKIIKNFLPEEFAQDIKRDIVNDRGGFGWKYNENTNDQYYMQQLSSIAKNAELTDRDPYLPPLGVAPVEMKDFDSADLDGTFHNLRDSPQFTHVLWNNLDSFGNPQRNYDGAESPYWSTIRPMFYFLKEKCNIQYKSIIRSKINLLIPYPNCTKNTFNFPHIDHPKTSKYLNAIYYVNDSDGDTFIFNELNEDGVPTDLTIKQRVTPEKNSVLIFPGNYYHASSNPVNNKNRIVINTTVEM